MPSRFRVTINEANLAWYVNSPAGPAVRLVTRYTGRTLVAARAGAPVDTGVGRAGMRSDVVITARAVTGRIFMPRHMWWQHQGTGVYAGKGPIRPKKGSYLVFRASRSVGPLRQGQKHPAPGKRQLVFAKQVKGVPPNPFLLNAMRNEVPWPVRYNR